MPLVTLVAVAVVAVAVVVVIGQVVAVVVVKRSVNYFQLMASALARLGLGQCKRKKFYGPSKMETTRVESRVMSVRVSVCGCVCVCASSTT